MLDALGQAFAALAVVCGIVAALMIALHGYSIALHVRRRRRGLAEEARLLATPIPDERALPHVAVQLPVYNEGRLVATTIARAAALDWPRDRLHIQVCDDSTDETTALARVAIEAEQRRGVDIVLIRRADRAHFKAGSLKQAMTQSGAEYFAIFDVDYAPPADFLRRCMPALIAHGDIAFLQARTDFRNADANLLTRAQTTMLDAHYAEQARRSWAGHPLPFNGTGGIWRRGAIEAGGGWRGETLVEDMELSYRAWLAGWRGTFVTAVAVPSELPADLAAWTTQQRRWTTGSAQVVRSLLPALWRSRLPLRQRAVALAQIALQAEGAVYAALLCSAALAAICRPADAGWLAFLVLALLAAEALVLVTEQWIGRRLFRAGQSLPRFFAGAGYALILASHAIWVNVRYFTWLLPGRRTVFERTPKRG